MEKTRWVPMRTRHDKTESVRRFKQKYGNYETTANRIWRSITNPFTIDDIKTLAKDGMYNKYVNILRGKVDHSIIMSEAQENALPPGYIVRLEIDAPDTDTDSNGYVSFELYRENTI